MQADVRAAAAWDRYALSHDTVRGLDGKGRFDDAVEADQSASAPVAASLDSTLSTGVDAAVSLFNRSATAAQSDLSGLMWASVLLMALVIIGVLAGTRPRLREYR
jgi:hypothetical protein